jgi:transposase-like protein
MNKLDLDFLETLSVGDKRYVISFLLEKVQESESNTKLTEVGINNTVCPHCNSVKVVKNGKVKDIQRFKCKECGKNFSIKTKTTFYHSHKPLTLWNKYIECMQQKLTLQKIADKLHINIKTAWLWRHKILSTIRTIKKKKMTGIVEADEVYFRESQKGSNNMTRQTHKRGSSKYSYSQLFEFLELTQEKYKKMKRKRGLSNDQICVLTVMDRKTHIFTKPAGLGKMKRDYLKWVQPEIATGVTLITDGEPIYRNLNVVKHRRLKHGLSKDRVYNIGRTNELHNSMKTMINGIFRGVATKYLDNYVVYCSVLKTSLSLFYSLLICNNYITEKLLRKKVAF